MAAISLLFLGKTIYFYTEIWYNSRKKTILGGNMKRTLSFILIAITLLSTLVLASCKNTEPDGSFVVREDGKSVEILNLMQTAEKNENFLDSEVSWYDDTYNYYVFYIGKIKNVPLTHTYSVFPYDGATLNYQREIVKATESSVETTTSQAVTSTVTTSTTDTLDLKVGLSASYMGIVGASIEQGYSVSTTNGTTTENVWNQTYRECITQSESETNTISITFDDSCKIGNYMYLYLGNLKVYYVVIQSRKDPTQYCVETFNSIESHKYALIYTGENDEYPIDYQAKIEIDPSFILSLSTPTKYIEGVKPEQVLEPVENTRYTTESKTIGGYLGVTWTMPIENFDEYYAEGYNKIHVKYEFYATAQWKLLASNTLNIDGYLANNKGDENGFHSFNATASTEGNWVRGEGTADLKWFTDSKSIVFAVYNRHNPILGDRDLTVNKITITYTLYYDQETADKN